MREKYFIACWPCLCCDPVWTGLVIYLHCIAIVASRQTKLWDESATALTKICSNAWWCGHCHQGRWEGWKALIIYAVRIEQKNSPFYHTLMLSHFFKSFKFSKQRWFRKTIMLKKARKEKKREESRVLLWKVTPQRPHSHILMMGGSDGGSHFIPKNIPTSEFVYPKKSLLFLAHPKKSLSVFASANFIIYLLES